MSSPAVRDAINAAVTAAAAPLRVYDLSDYDSLKDIADEAGDKFVAVQYVTADEEQQNIGGEGNQGWQENGSVVIHYLEPAGNDSAEAIAYGEGLRQQLRGRRIAASVVVESCDPFTDFGAGAVGMAGGSWKGWASNLYYEKRDCG